MTKAKYYKSRILGKYKNVATGQIYNVHKARHKQRNISILFYLYRGKRMFISDADFYSDNHIKIE